ncbi:MAG: CocE/NonD family hydrolase C-terminal non-catalytic domain-containing protein, partial [Spirochaetota bacterium]
VRPSVSEGTVAIRLSDVAPGGEAYRVTYGVLNLTHRVSHAEPESLEPGETSRIMVRLNGIAHRFAAGNRVRLAISTSYWPLIWTPKEFGPLAVIPESSTLTLPLNPGISEERGARTDEVAFEPSEAAPPLETWLEQPGESNWEMRRNLANDRSAVEVTKDDGATHIPEIDLTIRNRAFERYEISPGRPYSAVGHTHWTRGFERGPWRVSVETRTTLKADAESFIVDAELDAWEADRRVYAQNYHRVIPRDHV